VDNAKVQWAKARAFIKRECGIVLTDDQEYLLESRLGPVARKLGMPSTDELLEAIVERQPGSEASQGVIDALTTHESFFFRDHNFWRAFEECVMPQIIAAARGRRLRFWSSACSHGQEPYSLAMLLEEKWPDLARSCEIIATDVSAPAIARAREGTFSALEAGRGLSAQRLLRHFDRDTQGGFQIKELMRQRISWSVHNLLGQNRDPQDCDVAFCRNVLIYFSDADRRATLDRIEAAVRPGGFIALGGTETSPRVQVAPGMYERNAERNEVSL
jgi:chemotaxis protein methyltransferase CheR